MGWVFNTTPRPLYPRERPDTHCIGGWLAPRPVGTDAKNFAPARVRSPDRPARSESLYRLSYPGPPCLNVVMLIIVVLDYGRLWFAAKNSSEIPCECSVNNIRLYDLICVDIQCRTQEFFSGGGSTNSFGERGQRERGSGGGSPLVRGSGGSCNLVQEISFHIVKVS